MEESETEVQSPDELFLTAVVFEIALGLLALFLGWSLGPDARAMIPKVDSSEIWPIVNQVLWGLLATVPLLVFIEIVRRIPCEPVRELERLGEDGMMKSLLSLSPAEMVVISLCAGIGEELLFRGWLLYWLEGLYGRLFSVDAGSTAALVAALIVSSIAFGLVHPITKLYIVLAAIMGLYFGGLVIWTGSLLVPITAHAAYDAVQMILTSWLNKRKAAQPHSG
ncbi:CPBP family intramembrane metalloprotease [Rubripirellula amarantea]|uniref:CAAX amino terminal protease self-immunity n=1 Tax=Rubripirellula amarantea TaxID=2527999 RepID=A0A5C5WVL5_9BACT|nr:CPBP family intramembrane glutamic endopeptidase [Rubripirellula amarantea]MDA8745165.1 CPBP family intramembrane metalloprotease [Rubripirellula amarantea]TWT53882.1 CAAX amino terminal protease self- immunity [Rubripirellula amarantea]